MSFSKFEICNIDAKPEKKEKVEYNFFRKRFYWYEKSTNFSAFFLLFCSHAKTEEASSLLYTWLRYSCMNLSAPSVPAVLKK